MKDFTFIRLFINQVFLTFLIAITLIGRIRYIDKKETLSKKYLSLLQKKDLPIYFSTFALKSIVFRKTIKIRPKTEDVLSHALIKNFKSSLPLIHTAVKRNPKDIGLNLLLAQASFLANDNKTCYHIVDSLHLPFWTSSYHKNKYRYLMAQSELYQTDMLSASNHLSKALNFYQKKNAKYEEACCYLSLAQTYRITGIYDVATTMLNEAKKIYKNLNLPVKLAETEAYLGLTEIGRENYEIADQYLKTAAEICQNNHLTETLANINNWQGLNAYLNKDCATAETYLTKALKQTDQPATETFALSLLARICYEQKKYEKSLKNIEKALKTAHQTDSRADIFENLYLKAEIFYNQQKYDDSRQILTALIKEKTPPYSTYYPANAYTLLGIIEYKEKHLSIAQTLFKQALDLEHGQNRLKGAAIDYNNLAEVSIQMGDEEQARIYLNQAIKYTEEIADTEFLNLLKAKIK